MDGSLASCFEAGLVDCSVQLCASFFTTASSGVSPIRPATDPGCVLTIDPAMTAPLVVTQLLSDIPLDNPATRKRRESAHVRQKLPQRAVIPATIGEVGSARSLCPISSSNNITVHLTQGQGYVPIAAKGHKESVYALATNDHEHFLFLEERRRLCVFGIRELLLKA